MGNGSCTEGISDVSVSMASCRALRWPEGGEGQNGSKAGYNKVSVLRTTRAMTLFKEGDLKAWWAEDITQKMEGQIDSRGRPTL